MQMQSTLPTARPRPKSQQCSHRSPVVKKSLLQHGRVAEAVPEEGAEDADKMGPLRPAQMGPLRNQARIGALDTPITLRTGAAGNTGSGARILTSAATLPLALGNPGSYLGLRNRNRNRNYRSRRLDRRADSTTTWTRKR